MNAGGHSQTKPSESGAGLQNTTPKPGRRGYVQLGIIVASATVIVAVAWAVVLYPYRNIFGTEFSQEHIRWAEFGEYIGGLLNPFLGTLTLLGVVYTIYLQRDVLRVTRAQLNATALAEK